MVCYEMIKVPQIIVIMSYFVIQCTKGGFSLTPLVFFFGLTCDW